MRILGGIRQGRILHPPSNLPVRPTTERTRESVFNILSNQLQFEGLKVLELFAGTGMFSLDCASRGAETWSVDQHSGCVHWLKQASKDLDLPFMHARRADSLRYIQSAGPDFDLIFADPPYQWNGFNALLNLISQGHGLKTGGLFILEHASNMEPGFKHALSSRRHYGQSTLSFFVFDKKILIE